jgi:hypothetical protein
MPSEYLYDDLVKESKDLASSLLSTSLVVVHDAIGGGEHKVTEATSGEHVLHPLLHLVHRAIETGRDNSALVDAADQVNNNLATAVIIENLEFANVALKNTHQ